MGVELWRTSKAHTMAARTICAMKPWFFEKGVREERRLRDRIAELQLENSRLRRLVTDLLLEKTRLEEAASLT